MHKIGDLSFLGVSALQRNSAAARVTSSVKVMLSGTVLRMKWGDRTASSLVCTLWRHVLASPYLLLQPPGPASAYNNELK